MLSCKKYKKKMSVVKLKSIYRIIIYTELLVAKIKSCIPRALWGGQYFFNTLVFDSGNIVNISGNIFLYPPQGHPILYNYYTPWPFLLSFNIGELAYI